MKFGHLIMVSTFTALCSARPDGVHHPHHHHRHHHHHLGDSLHHYGTPYHHHPGYHAPVQYAFEYGVQDDISGSNFGHSETRNGHHGEGKYFVHLPDGRLQTVTYYTDEHGYHPTVTYENVAKLPAYPAPVPGYY